MGSRTTSDILRLLGMLGLIAAGVPALAWCIRRHLEDRRLRRKLESQGRLGKPGDCRKSLGDWLRIVPVLLLGFLAYWVSKRAEPALGWFWSSVLPWGGLILLILVFSAARVLRGKDSVVRRAARLAKHGQNQQAVGLLKAALDDDAPPQIVAQRLAALGELAFQQEQWDEADRFFGSAYERNPEYPVYLVNRVQALDQLGRAEEGLALIETARQARPAEAALAFAAALLLTSLGRINEAAEQMRQADELQQVAASEQRTDALTRCLLRQLCKQRLENVPARAFPLKS